VKVLLIGNPKELEQDIALPLKLRWPEIIVVATEDGEKGIELVEIEQPDIVLLDCDLPDTSCFTVLSEIRLFSEVPIVTLTASIDVMDKVKALEMGADEWINKPVNHMELLAKVNAVLRRCGIIQSQQYATPFVSSKLTINFADREVCISGNPVRLTPTEYKLLCCLVRNEGKVVSHRRLLDSIWGSEYTDDIGFLKKYIYRLRSKVEESHENPQMIITERGIGYKFIKPISPTK